MKQKIIGLVFIFSTLLKADQFAFLLYNDFFAGTDKHFTSGVALSWLDDTYKLQEDSSRYAPLAKKLPFGNSLENCTAGLSIHQIIITPSDTDLKTPQYDDMPYTSYLGISAYLFKWSKQSFHEYRVEAGVVGDEAGGEAVQNNFHKIIGSKKSEGWDTQLATQYTLTLLYKYGEISWQKKSLNGLDMDWFNQAGFEAGNFSTDVFGSSMFRIGKNYIQNFNVHYPYLKEEAALLKRDTKHKGFGWAASVGVNMDILAYSYILQEAKDEGYDLDQNTLNASVYAGIDLYYNVHRFTFFYQSQSPYSKQQNSLDTFGGFSYSFAF